MTTLTLQVPYCARCQRDGIGDLEMIFMGREYKNWAFSDNETWMCPLCKLSQVQRAQQPLLTLDAQMALIEVARHNGHKLPQYASTAAAQPATPPAPVRTEDGDNGGLYMTHTSQPRPEDHGPARITIINGLPVPDTTAAERQSRFDDYAAPVASAAEHTTTDLHFDKQGGVTIVEQKGLQCPECDGTGRVLCLNNRVRNCSKCHGKGVLSTAGGPTKGAFLQGGFLKLSNAQFLALEDVRDCKVQRHWMADRYNARPNLRTPHKAHHLKVTVSKLITLKLVRESEKIDDWYNVTITELGRASLARR